MNRGAWRALVHGVAKKSDMTEQLSMHFIYIYIYIYIYIFNVIYNLKCIFRCKVTSISLKAFQALVKIISLFSFHLFWRPGPSLAKLRTPRTCIWIL